MTTDRKKAYKRHGSPFAIQLLECVLVNILLIVSLLLAGKLIYNNAFPFGWISGGLLYMMMAAIAIIILGANKYFSFTSRPLPEMAVKIVSLVILLNFILIAFLYFNRSIRLSPYYFIVSATLQIVFLLLIKRFTYLLKTNIFKNRVSLVVGKDQEKSQLILELSGKSLGRLAFASYKDKQLDEYIQNADNVFLSSLLSKRVKDHIISSCILQNRKVFIVPETYEIAMRKAEMTQLGDIPLFAIESFRLSEIQNLLKRLMDLILAVVGILMSAPIMLYAAVRIKLEDGGPVFYCQERSGINGKPFQVMKFRSMVVDAEKYTGAVFASENDPRVTKTGRLMRATRIDEIPQFFNVLMGSMSIVGPRPERPQFVEEFSMQLPEYAGRLAVKPGITGLAQVMGNYTTSADYKAKFDLVYIRDYSLLLDLRILIKTIKVVFNKSQSIGFSDRDSMNSFNPQDLLVVIREPRDVHRNHWLGKAILVVCCAGVIVFGCTLLRFNAITETMVAASGSNAQTSNTELPVLKVEAEDVAAPIDTDAVPVDSDAAAASAVTAADVQKAEVKQTDADAEGTEVIKTKVAVRNTNDKITLPEAANHSSDKQESQSREAVIVSQEQVNQAVDKMSVSEKFGIAYDLISRLSAEDLMKLDRMSEGGFTAKEKEAAKSIMHQYFNDEEVEYIKEIYWEYVN